MDPLLVLALSLLVAVVVLVEVGRRTDRLPEYVSVTGPFVTIYTRRGTAVLDAIARPARLWTVGTTLGAALAGALLVGTCVAIISAGYLALTTSSASGVTEPRNALLIPGVNDFLPLSVAVEILLAALVGIGVHEIGHGVLCRIEEIDITSIGVTLVSYVPLGAFVAVDPDSSERASWTSRTRTFAAGITVNFVTAGVCLLGLAILVSTLVTPVAGAPIGGVVPGSAADEAGLDRGDVIVGVDGNDVDDADSLSRSVDEAGRTVTVETAAGETTTVERRPQVVSATPEAPLPVGASIERVNATPVHTEREFHRAVSNRTTVTVDTGDGSETFVAGAAATAAADGPLADAGAPSDRRLVVTRVDDRRTPNASALVAALDEAEPGETVPVSVAVDGTVETHSVRLAEGDAPDDARLGVYLERGVSGLEVDDLGLDPYPAGWYADVLGGSGDPLKGLGLFLTLPVAGLVDIAPYNFAGFGGDVQAFYSVAGPLGAVDGAVFFVATLLFWSAWINVNLALFNCFPIVPLDGGRLLQIWTGVVADRVADRYATAVTAGVTNSVSAITVAGLLSILFAGYL